MEQPYKRSSSTRYNRFSVHVPSAMGGGTIRGRSVSGDSVKARLRSKRHSSARWPLNKYVAQRELLHVQGSDLPTLARVPQARTDLCRVLRR